MYVDYLLNTTGMCFLIYSIGFFFHKERSSTGTHKGSNILGSYYYTKNSRDCLAFSCSQFYN